MRRRRQTWLVTCPTCGAVQTISVPQYVAGCRVLDAAIAVEVLDALALARPCDCNPPEVS